MSQKNKAGKHESTIGRPHEVVLDNGFRALLVERPGLPVVASTLWYRVGSRDERTGQTGCSHLLEHMMFKGTDRYAKGEIDRLTSRMGGSNNAFTDNDTTAYWFALASDRWEAALEIEADRMVGCAFEPDEFAAEKNVVLEELAMYDDDPWNRMWVAGEATAFQVHPYHHPIIGWKEDLERLPVEGLRGYYERHYGPDRSFLVIVGAFERDRTEARIRELFGGLRPAGARETVLAEPVPRGQRRLSVRIPGQTVRLAMAVPTCRAGTVKDFGLDVFANALAGGRSSRLFQDLVIERELATGVSAHNEARLDPGLLWILVELRPGADLRQVEELVHRHLADIGKSGLRPGEFRRARAQLLSQWTFEEETVLDVAQRIGRFESVVADGYQMIDRVPELYEAVDNKLVRDLVHEFARPDRFTVVEGVPEEVAPARRRKDVQRTETRRKTRGAKKKPARKSAAKAAAKKGATKSARKKVSARSAVAKPAKTKASAATKSTRKKAAANQPTVAKQAKARASAVAKSVGKKPGAKKSAAAKRATKKAGGGKARPAASKNSRRRKGGAR